MISAYNEFHYDEQKVCKHQHQYVCAVKSKVNTPAIEMSALAISGESASIPPSSPPTFTSDSVKDVWLMFAAGVGKGSKNLLVDEVDAFETTGDAAEDVLESSLAVSDDTDFFASSPENRFGSEKSGKVSFEPMVVAIAREGCAL